MTIQSRPSPMDPPCPVPTLYYTAWEWVHGGGDMHDSLPKPCRGSSMSKSPEGDKKYSNLFIHGLIHPFRPSHKNPRRDLVAIHVTSAIRLPCGWSMNSHVTSTMLPCGWPFQLSHEPALYRTDLGLADLMLEHSWLASFLTHESWHSELTSALYTHGKNHPWCSSLICVVVEIADFSHDVHHWSWLWSKWLTSSMVFITDLCCSTNGWLIPWCSSLISVVVQMADLYYDAHHWSLLWHNGWLLPWCSSLISVVVQMTDFFHGVHHWSLL